LFFFFDFAQRVPLAKTADPRSETEELASCSTLCRLRRIEPGAQEAWFDPPSNPLFGSVWWQFSIHQLLFLELTFGLWGLQPTIGGARPCKVVGTFTGYYVHDFWLFVWPLYVPFVFCRATAAG